MLHTLLHADPESLAAIGEEMRVRGTREIFILFVMGSQFDHLIKQALDKIGVYCLAADPKSVTAHDLRLIKPTGIIISGGPASAYSEPPPFDGHIFNLRIPVLGICLGFQVWAKYRDIDVLPAVRKEYGVHELVVRDTNSLFYGLPSKIRVLESHGDNVVPDHSKLSKIFELASTENAPVAAGECLWLYGVQFHPEVSDTEYGLEIFKNFCFRICKAKDRYPAGDVSKRKIEEIRQQVGDGKVLLALSGGSDSSVVAYLLKAALGGEKGRIKAIYIKGLDRPDDKAFVLKYFGGQDWIDLEIVNATQIFLGSLAGVVSMKDKRMIMRPVYKVILEEEALKFGATCIAQGTLYTDISESGGGYDSGARKAQIKQHHNVGLNFSIPELLPLADMVKDNARGIGRAIGVPEELLTRHPFPGPGLLVRIEGQVDAARLELARDVDRIWIEELRKEKLYDTVWQAGATVLSSSATFTKGDDAGTGSVVCLWAFWSVNGFTAQAAKLSQDFIAHVARRICNEVSGVARVLYNYTDKPSGTIEWG